MLKLLLTVCLVWSVSQTAMATESFKTLVCQGKVTDFGKNPDQTFQLNQTLTVQDPSEPGVGFASLNTKVYNGEVEVGATALQTNKTGLPKSSVVIRLDDRKSLVGLLSGTGGGSLLNGSYIPEGEGALLNYNRVNKDGSKATVSVIVECQLK